MTSFGEPISENFASLKLYAGLVWPIRGRILWTLILLFLMIICGAHSVVRGVDVMWDLKNYHLYNPFAVYHDRYMLDIAPAQLQSYLNPLLDFPFYAAVALFNDRPRLISFLMGAAQGFNLLAVTLLAWHCLGSIGGLPRQARVTLTLMALAIGATGAGTTPLIGSTTGDLLAAVPILIGLYFLLRGVDAAAVSPRTAWRDLMLAGGFAGLGVGSKLTMASYGVAMAAALLVLPRCVLVRGLARFLAASVVGGLVTGGYHHLRMLRLFGNPLFPMMNNVFQSPYWEHDTLRVTGFPPKTLFDTMFYPFEWAINSQYGIVSELAFRDIRIALTMSLGVLVLVKWGLGLPFGRRIASTVPSSIRALVIFGLVAYIIWLPLFSIYRYLLPLEMLSGVFIVLALAALARQAVLTVAAAGAAFACIATTVPLEWGHGAFGDRYVEVSAPVLPPDTVVVLVGDEPVSYLIPFMGLDTIWLGLSNNFLRPDQRNLLVRREHDLISSHKDRLMVLKTGAPPDLHSAVLSAFDLAVDNGNCKSIYSNLNSQPYQLCPVVARSKDDGLH